MAVAPQEKVRQQEDYQHLVKVVRILRTAKVVKGGRRFSIMVIVIVGDGAGSVGYGVGKAKEVRDAVQKATDVAKKNMHKVSLRGSTIQHMIVASHGATKVFMKPATRGTGVIAGGPMRSIFECLGVSDVLAKCIGSSNPMNVVLATMKGLIALQEPSKVAYLRGVPVHHVLGVRGKEHASTS